MENNYIVVLDGSNIVGEFKFLLNAIVFQIGLKITFGRESEVLPSSEFGVFYYEKEYKRIKEEIQTLLRVYSKDFLV